MSVSPTNLLQLSKDLLAQAKSEVDFRNAIGRAYYAAFHAAVAFHDSLPTPGELPPKRMGMHMELAYQLSRPTLSQSDPRFKISRTLGNDLNWLHNERIQADYKLNALVTPAEAATVIQRSEAAIKLIPTP